MEGAVDKDRYDACMKLADFATGRWDARRSHEANLSFAIWAMIAAAILCVRAEQFPWGIGAGLVFLHVVWLRATDIRNRSDGRIAWNCVRAADEVLGMNLVPPKPPSIPIDWAMPVKFAFTLGLVLLFYAICVEHPTLLAVEAVVLKQP